MSKKSNFYEVFTDFEFNRINEEKVNLVCAVTEDASTGEIKKWWLHNNIKNQKALRKYLAQFKLVSAYAATAEGRSFYSLGLNVFDFRWYDMFTEYRMITNHNDELQWGKQLVRGKVKHVRKPKNKWERTEADFGTGFVATHSLAEAEYKLCGTKRDTDHKNAMRDLIIRDPAEFSKKDQKSIMDYCLEDVVNLKNIKRQIIKHHRKLLPNISKKQYMKGALERGDFIAATALMEAWGYPINYKATLNFSNQVNNIFYDLQREINILFPDIKPFVWNKREGRFSWNQKRTKDWIRDNFDVDLWMKTDKGDISLALEAWTRFFDFKHDYPKDNFGAQMVRFLKLRQNMYGFKVSEKEQRDKKNFWDYVGPDKVVRPYLNPFKAQSSRSQPAATGFMFLKPAWMRALVQPPKGYYCCGIDYGSQEFFISALMSKDQAMIEAYLSGDPYFYFAKAAGAVPEDGKKEDYKTERNLFKATTLGLSYLMSKVGLAVKLTQDTGREWDEDEAQDMIDMFYELYWRLKEYQEDIQEEYASGNPLILDDGWAMFTDNENIRSVGNMPIQGAGAVIMRRAAVMAMKKYGIRVMFPLHDALYIIGKEENMEKEILLLRKCMRKAFLSVFPKEDWKYAKKIRLDAHAWGSGLKDGTLGINTGKGTYPVHTSTLYIDDRAINDYNMFSQYFEDRIEDRLNTTNKESKNGKEEKGRKVRSKKAKKKRG